MTRGYRPDDRRHAQPDSEQLDLLAQTPARQQTDPQTDQQVEQRIDRHTSSEQARITRAAPRPANMRLHLQQIAEDIDRAWHRAHGGSRIEIPLGTVATLCLIGPTELDRPKLEQYILGLDAPALMRLYQSFWARLWMNRPYLVDVASPIHRWLEDGIDDRAAKAVRAVTQAAIQTGMLELTASPDPWWRSQADVLGPVLTGLRSQGGRRALAEFHTPAEVADALARLTIGDEAPSPGQWISDPAAGTGGLIRAAALALRERGQDPADYVWVMTDIDPLACACAAVNSLIWGLGSNVLVHCGDTLAEGDGAERALRRRAEVIAHREEMVGKAAVIAAVHQTMQLLDIAAREHDETSSRLGLTD
ncbi:N-6 DNA methylase [Actinomadura miaoliensis]|uniref:N-6 DNA methylase n=1 Tax=Actinomadura miaoliensis TaxID=430685 RepID=A0ABP7WB66_9ACTN